MNIIGNLLDHIKIITKIALDMLTQILSEPNNKYHEIILHFLEFHGVEFAEEKFNDLFGIDQTKDVTLTQMLKYLKLNRLEIRINEELNEQGFILDFIFNTDLIDEILVVYFNTKKEIILVSHES